MGHLQKSAQPLLRREVGARFEHTIYSSWTEAR